MKLLSQTTSPRVEVVVTLGQEAQEEESQVSQGTDEALMINLETVFLNQVEVAQDQVAVVESQILAEPENQVTEASQILAELEDQAVVAKDVVVIQQTNHIINKIILTAVVIRTMITIPQQSSFSWYDSRDQLVVKW